MLMLHQSVHHRLRVPCDLGHLMLLEDFHLLKDVVIVLIDPPQVGWLCSPGNNLLRVRALIGRVVEGPTGNRPVEPGVLLLDLLREEVLVSDLFVLLCRVVRLLLVLYVHPALLVHLKPPSRLLFLPLILLDCPHLLPVLLRLVGHDLQEFDEHSLCACGFEPSVLQPELRLPVRVVCPDGFVEVKIPQHKVVVTVDQPCVFANNLARLLDVLCFDRCPEVLVHLGLQGLVQPPRGHQCGRQLCLVNPIFPHEHVLGVCLVREALVIPDPVQKVFDS
mmetsp:Transcript_42476/g.83737  ORF Transcript_42476/g.83737 Transcript_42476/m.83737 type:complete len:277 (+) Transcript_42476:871-1701(+)